MKKKNTQDATLINVRALKKQVKALEKRVKTLEVITKSLDLENTKILCKLLLG